MTTTQTIATADQRSVRWGLAALVLTVSAWVVAGSNEGRLVISPAEDSLLSDEMYDRADGWREPPMLESEWRAPEPEPKSRIRFGYDSAYDELRARDDGAQLFGNRTIHDTRPSTLFRLEF